MNAPAMLRALRALLYKVLLISVLCKFLNRLKRILGIKASSSGGDLLSSAPSKSSADSALTGADGEGSEEPGEWGSWDNREAFSIEVTGQRGGSSSDAKVYSSKALNPPPEPEEVQPEINFFGDMEPVIDKQAQKVRITTRHAAASQHNISNRFAFKEATSPVAELEAWDDDSAEPVSAWDDDVMDDTEADAISAEAKKQRREVERHRRQQERDQRRVQLEQRRQEQLQRKQLGMKIS